MGKQKNNDNPKKISVGFAAIDQYVTDNIVNPTEKTVNGQAFVQYGDKNAYPSYLFELYSKAATLKAVIEGTVDYILGDKVTCEQPFFKDKANNKVLLEDFVRQIALDLLIYGGTAINVQRNYLGQVCALVNVDMRNIRSDKDNEFFYYSDDFGKKSYGRSKYIKYPAFDIDDKATPNSIYFYKNQQFQTYPSPKWSSAVIAAELERDIDEYHLNNINNNFTGGYVVNMNNGIPTDEQQEEIVENFEEKFSGYQNAGRVVVAFNNDKDHQTTIEKIESEDWGEKYKALADRSRQQLLTAFKASPQLFGINLDNKGFAQEEYDNAFRLYNRTTVRPFQKTICRIFEEITGQQDVLKFKPFSIDWEDDENNEEIVK